MGLPIRSVRFAATKSLPRTPMPSALFNIRRLNLVAILVLATATVILGLVYSWCVDHYRTNKVDGTNRLYIRSWGDDPNSIAAPVDSGDTSLYADITTLPSPEFFFYSVTLPFASLFHAVACLISQMLDCPRFSNLRTTSSNPVHAFGAKVSRTMKTPLSHIIVSVLIFLGWVTTSTFWLHCELPKKLHPSPQSMAMCPAALRDHFMYGIREVSVAKTVAAMLIVLLYLFDIIITTILWRKVHNGHLNSSSPTDDAVHPFKRMSEQEAGIELKETGMKARFKNIFA